MSILDEIIEHKKQELNSVKSDSKKFKEIFAEKNANIIWEIKLASPKFDYSSKIDLEKVFEFYWENNDIKAVSILIDEKYFAGDIKRWKAFKQKYQKPIFFKEFVIDKAQIDGASYFGYDALLLLARVLDDKKLEEFIKYCYSKNIFPIVEVDCEQDMERVLNLPLLTREGLGEGFWIAINCRNLWTMEIDRKRHFKIYKKFEEKLADKLIFAFSWIDDLEQVEEYKWKFNGVLVGTYFMERMKDDL